MYEKARYKYRVKCLKASAVLLLAVLVTSVVYVFIVNSITRTRVYEEMLEAATDSVETLEYELRSDRTMLRMIAKVISESEGSLHSLKVNQYLTIYDANSRITDVAILLTDDRVIRVSGMDIDGSGVLDFDEIDKKGEHISSLLPDLEVEGVMDIRSFVPIRKNGQTIAYIYSATTPDEILNGWLPNVYDGHAYISVIDRENGKLIIDSSGSTGDSISDKPIKMVASSTGLPLDEAIISGTKGYAIIRDANTGALFYECHVPMDIENWELLISVPQKDVYTSVESIRICLYVFLALLALMLLIYFLHILRITSGSIDGIERRANVDALTRLQNRNRFEYFCEHLQQGTDGMACMYFDVNGLHEMNNERGHAAGDEMLKTIADILQKEYGEPNTYRIGGDEFVTFRYDRDEKAVRATLEKVSKEVIDAGYHVACGMAMATPDKKLAVVIKEAETRMYEDKEKYYKSIGREMRT